MAARDFPTILTCDARFTKRGTQLKQTCSKLSLLFDDAAKIGDVNSSINFAKNGCYLLNALQVANKNGDSFVTYPFELQNLCEILKTGRSSVDYISFSESDLKSKLGSDYLDYKSIKLPDTNDEDCAPSDRIHFLTQRRDEPAQLKQATQTSQKVAKSSNREIDENYWIQSVKLDFPYIPQPDATNVVESFVWNSQQYCIYGEANLPWNQSQITALTDVNQFSDRDVLKLFPDVRLYTRSQYMYKEYDFLDYDDDLGVILKIKGHTKKQIRKNILEYPHLEFLDRWVKVKGKETTLPFWKHIEIDGEIVPTASVWGKLPDTKKLPQTESFMNEYVVRKYILERDKGVEHKYPMRGSLYPFLTLYAPPSYYEEHGYDPIEVGRKCIQSRVDFKRSRNPVLKILEELNEIDNAEMPI